MIAVSELSFKRGEGVINQCDREVKQMDKFYIARADEIEKIYDEKGFAITELLEGSHDGSIHNYKGFLKAGSEIRPELFPDKIVIYMFGKGRGYVADQNGVNDIVEEVSFYFPDFDKNPYKIHAFEDMEFIKSVVNMEDYDWDDYQSSHVRLPYFRPLSKCPRYDQDCKGAHTTSWHVLNPKQLGHVILGVVRAVGEGTDEKGHPAVHQWNYCLGNSDFDLTVDGETTRTQAGDWRFIPAGPDHSLIAQPGKEVFYVWYEQYTRGAGDYIVKLAKDEKEQG